MSSHSFPKIDQKEYLKKYLSGDKVKKKKKDKKHKKRSAAAKVKIIDDDINHLDTGLEIDEELLLTGEDAPQIVGEYIEEKPSDEKVPKWKSIAVKEEPQEDREDGTATIQNNIDLWGRNSGKSKTNEEFNFNKKHKEKYSDNSPPRRYKKNFSPDRKTKDKYEQSLPSCSKHIKYPSPDHSPPRKEVRKRSIDSSPRRRRSSDQSSLRGKTQLVAKERKRSPHPSSSDRIKNSDQSPPRRSRKSPQKSHAHSPDCSPPPRRRYSDQSPPRKNKLSIKQEKKYSADQSPPRRNRDSDHSLPRKKISTYKDRKHSPNILNQRKKRDSDQSPQRRKGNSPDRSPPRRRRNSDQSPRTSKRVEKLSPDQSPPRRHRISPSRIKCERLSPVAQLRQSRWELQESEKSPSPPPTHKPKPIKTLEGKRAGLQNAEDLHKEAIERRKQEERLFEKMSSDISGRDAEIQVRNTGRKGRKAREALEENPEERRRREAHEEKKKLLYERWGKGLKQIEDHKNRQLELEHESNKPLARYSNDEDLERHLKEQERPEDPMLDYMRRKRKEKEKLSDKPQIPRYEGPFPENRFGIRPGYRWDGVDRSNGYEKKYFAIQNEKRARQDEAYKYSVEDM